MIEPERQGAPSRRLAERVLDDLAKVDRAVYLAVESADTAALDGPLRRLSMIANRSVLWLIISAAVAALGGRSGRRAAGRGVVAIGISSAVVNLGLKALHRRPRPERADDAVLIKRHVPMPASSSFPSGHSASGFAFAGAVGVEMPVLAFPLRMLAAAVAYSRVHTGVHYPGDAVAGALVGATTGQLVSLAMDRLGVHGSGRGE